MSLNYTPLRHKMLVKIAKGRVSINDDDTWNFHCFESTAPQMARACNWAWKELLIGVYREPGQVQISDDGQAILNRWNAQYGDPT